MERYHFQVLREAQQLEVRDRPKSDSSQNERRQNWIVPDMH